ncbi:MAG TPA: MlaD family protein [Nocardioidaceae bacterium]|nr:MlaD family protein [Nocardioidaceae bacterium]
MQKWFVPATALALVAVAFKLAPDNDYELELLMPSAEGSFVGARTMIAGQEVGRVSEVGVDGNKAKVTVVIDDEHAPLHAGTTARITWNSVIGRRQVELVPGAETNPELPSGKVVESNLERVELDDLVAALDGPTREKVQRLVQQLEVTLDGNEGNLQQTLNSAGPFVAAIGEVLKGVGQDGPAIRRLVTQLHTMTQTLSARDNELAATVQNLQSLVSAAADQQEQIRAALDEVPGTVRAGSDFFSRVPAAIDATLPLLEDLRPATAKLPSVAKNLNPVLTDLRPTVAELRPALQAARMLLGETPDLLDMANSTVPAIGDAVTSLLPAVAFLRPYTPEIIGFLSNWTSLFSAKNSAGHFGRAMVPVSASMLNDNPGILPPGMTQDKAPLPGELAGQPWTDANGDGVR